MELHLETLDEFETLFDGSSPEVTLGIFEGMRSFRGWIRRSRSIQHHL